MNRTDILSSLIITGRQVDIRTDGPTDRDRQTDNTYRQTDKAGMQVQSQNRHVNKAT